MRVIFMGTPDFAVPALIALVEAGHEVVAAYSQPPRPGGRRGKELTPSPVQREAEARGIAVRHPVSLKGAAEQAEFAAFGADVAIVSGIRNGQPFRKEIDIPRLFLKQGMEEDIVLAGGDTLYVHRAPVFYIYGEAQRPGAYRIERNMTVMQALALGGGPTVRGSEWRLRLDRKNAAGVVEELSPEMSDPIQPNDVLYVREALF